MLKILAVCVLLLVVSVQVSGQEALVEITRENAHQLALLKTLSFEGYEIGEVALSNTGQFLAVRSDSFSDSHVIEIWDISSEPEQLAVHTYDGRPDWIFFNARNDLLFITDSSLKVWSGTDFHTVLFEKQGTIAGLYVSPSTPIVAYSIDRDDDILSTSIEGVSVIDLISGTELAYLPHSGANNIVFSADGRRLFTGSADGSILEWREPYESKSVPPRVIRAADSYRIGFMGTILDDRYMYYRIDYPEKNFYRLEALNLETLEPHPLPFEEGFPAGWYGDLFYMLDERTYSIQFWHLLTGELLAELEGALLGGNVAGASRDESVILLNQPDAFYLVDVKTGERLFSILPEYGFRYIINEKGQIIAANTDTIVTIWGVLSDT